MQISCWRVPDGIALGFLYGPSLYPLIRLRCPRAFLGSVMRTMSFFRITLARARSTAQGSTAERIRIS